MQYVKCLSFCLLLALADASPPPQSISRRVVKSFHRKAVEHYDLRLKRLASTMNTHSPIVESGHSGGGANVTSNGTESDERATETAATSSPWKLVDSHVRSLSSLKRRILLFFICRKGPTFSADGSSGVILIQRMACFWLLGLCSKLICVI